MRAVFSSIDSDANGQISAAEMAAARPPTPPFGGLDSGAFNTLLNSQSNETSNPRSRRPGEQDSDSHSTKANDSALQRMLAAYRNREPASPGSGITA